MKLTEVEKHTFDLLSTPISDKAEIICKSLAIDMTYLRDPYKYQPLTCYDMVYRVKMQSFLNI